MVLCVSPPHQCCSFKGPLWTPLYCSWLSSGVVPFTGVQTVLERTLECSSELCMQWVRETIRHLCHNSTTQQVMILNYLDTFMCGVQVSVSVCMSVRE